MQWQSTIRMQLKGSPKDAEHANFIIKQQIHLEKLQGLKNSYRVDYFFAKIQSA